MRQVISSQVDEKFRPVHLREWNLAAIGLPRVNPKHQRRPTMTPREMTTLSARPKDSIKPHLKTEAGLRDIDLHPDAARILRNFIGDRTTGFLFRTANGTMLDPGNIDRDSLSTILEEMGRDEVGTRFNVFRRFREAVLQRSEARQILIDYWMGHSNPSIGDRYGKQLVEDVEYRQVQVKKVGLGFDLPPSLFGLRGLQNAGSDRKKEAA